MYPLLSQSGAIYQINFIVWPVIYGLTGFHTGSLSGSFPRVFGAVAGAIIGFVAVIPLARAMFYDVEAAAPVSVALVYIFVPVDRRIWFLMGICLLPGVRLLARKLAGK